ncbi:MAG: LysM peptidoglycan-binding domain-containing protein [Blastococcus sp.]
MTTTSVVLAPAGRADPVGPDAPAAAPGTIEDFAPYGAQSVCDPVSKPGTTAMAETILEFYGVGRHGGTTRDCSVGGPSEHKDGRAWDWMLSVSDLTEKATAEQFIAWLTAAGPDGQDAYNARRFGVMYVIWNQHIWSAGYASSGWLPYSGSSPHTDHVHVSLSWSGAMKQTSWWTGIAAGVDDGPQEAPPSAPEPAPVGEGHTVVLGDTLWEVSQATGIPVEVIMSVNQLTSDQILPGQVLSLPG